MYSPFFRATGENVFLAAELCELGGVVWAPCVYVCMPVFHLPNITLHCGSIGAYRDSVKL